MENNETQPNKSENYRNPDGTFKPGNPGSPGRPKGKTLKEFAREYLMNLPDDKKQEYLATLPKDIVWKMAEGNPHQSTEVDAKGNIVIAFDPSFKSNEDTGIKG